MSCSRCPRPAVQVVYGHTYGGQRLTDPRCDMHRLSPSRVGQLVMDSRTGTRYRISGISEGVPEQMGFAY
jgi:hypothetical protein